MPSFGALSSQLLVVGFAPGLKGANRTGRPFTGDSAGRTLSSSLLANGFAKIGSPDQNKLSVANGPELINCRITNAVRCVPPKNKPEAAEIRQCNGFLAAEIKAMPNLSVILALGIEAHKAVVRALGVRASAHAFKHGTERRLQLATRDLRLLNSYHCSQLNINNRTLTQDQLDEVFRRAKELMP